jgi:hypothetical protein
LGVGGEVRAAYGLSLTRDQDSTNSLSSAGTCSLASDLDRENRERVPALRLFDMVVNFNGGFGAAGSVSSGAASPSGMPAAVSKSESIPIPFVTLLRCTRDRVAAISHPSSVFEPPRSV